MLIHRVFICPQYIVVGGDKMKKFTCYDCEEVFEAETAKEVLDKMHPHYLAEHKEVMAKAKKEDHEKWMITFNKDWDAIEEE